MSHHNSPSPSPSPKANRFFGVVIALALGGLGLLFHYLEGNPAIRKSPASLVTQSTVKVERSAGFSPKPVQGQSQSKGSDEKPVIMNDPFISAKWGLARTDSQRAWTVSQGSTKIVVAVIDTGIDIRHRDFESNLWTNAGETGLDGNGKDKATNGIDDDKNGYIDDVHGWNFVSNNSSLTDNHGHGTHISGIIGARGGNGFGISGVAPKVSLMTLKYYDPKVPATNNLKNTIRAIEYAIDMGATIINYSGGGTEFSQEEFEAIKKAESKGILFVAAAGNERSNTDEPGKHYYPADYELTNIISVTAVNEKDTKVLPSSNYGVRTVHLAAPGDQIYSTLPDNKFGYMTGTSQATAFVTGVAVLIKALRSEFDYQQIKKYIIQNGDEYPTLLSKTGSAKLLNSYKSLTNLDLDVSIGGVITANTQGGDRSAFQSDAQPESSRVDQDPTQDPALGGMADFGRSLIDAIEGRSPSRSPRTRTRGPGSAEDPRPSSGGSMDVDSDSHGSNDPNSH